MNLRVARNLGVLTTAAAVALGSTGVAIAKHGSDDPAPQLRNGADDGLVKKASHHRRHRRADDVKPHFKHGADDVKPHFKRGADDPAGDQRHGGGADDPAGHR